MHGVQGDGVVEPGAAAQRGDAHHLQRAVQRALAQQHGRAGRAHTGAAAARARRHGRHLPGTC